MKAATEAYFSEQDLLGQWIEDCCDVHLADRKLWDRSADLFDSWTAYAQKAGEDPGTKKAFGMAIQKKGFQKDRVNGERAFRHVRLKLAEAGYDFNRKQTVDA